MKGKLNRRDGDYWLHNESGETIASSWGVYGKKLSGQNCDEIFGVVDVEKLAEEEYPTIRKRIKSIPTYNQEGFIKGFNKAMELNKEKLFTEEDLRKAIRFGFHFAYGYLTGEKGTIEKKSDRYIQSIQHPTEIDVEIKMEPCFYDDSLGGFSTSYTEDKPKEQPKLDSEGCLILKRFNIK